MRIRILNPFKALSICAVGIFFAASGLAQNKPARTEPNMDEVISDGFVLSGAPLDSVLGSLSQLTGRAILRPQALPTPEITFDPGGPITRGELILAIESLLSLNNIGVSPLGDRFLKVVPLNAIKTEAPELVTQSLADRAPSGKVVSKLFRLQYLDSQTFQQQIQPFLSPTFGSIIPFQNSNAVIVTDTVSNLQRFEYLVSEVDKPSRLNIETVFYTLQYAEATEVAQRIQGMIDDARNRFGNQNGQSGSGGSNARNNRRINDNPETPGAATLPAAGEGEFSTQILFGSNTAITADERTNQLILMTEPGNLKFFEEIIRKLDVKADPSTRIEVIPLKHADATEVASLLSDFVSGKSRSETSSSSSSSRSGSSSRSTRAGRSLTFPGTETETPTPRQTEATTATPVVARSGEDRDSQFSNYTTIKADERSNALVVSGTRNDLELLRTLIDQIDVLLAQVRIEVIITEVNLNENEGISRGMDAFGFKYEQSDENGEHKVTLGDTVNFLGLGIGGSSFNYDNGHITNLTLDAIFNTVRTNDNVHMISQPTLVTTHNKEASIVVGEARPIVTSSQTSSVTDSTRSSVQYQNIGIELKVTPLIGPNNVIQLEIDQTIDNIAGNVTIDGNQQPIIGKRQATSYVSVADGQLVVLGGLQSENTAKGKSRSAFLGEVPLLGALFSRHRDESKKSELMVFIRPKIIRTTDEVNADALQKLETLESDESLRKFMETGSLTKDEETSDDEDVTSPRNRPKGFRK